MHQELSTLSITFYPEHENRKQLAAFGLHVALTSGRTGPRLSRILLVTDLFPMM
jgi:hypothetical protein